MVQDAVRQMALGITQMQDAGISHHDLKEANVFITSDGTFKIGDFGLPNLLDDHDQQVDMAQNTPGYEPDELCEKGKLGEKSDNFTLGTILDLMTDPARRSNTNLLPTKKPSSRVVAQQTMALEDPGDTESSTVVRATVFDRLRNALLSPDQEDRPEMTQVLLSTYLGDLERAYIENDVKKLRLASAAYKAVVERLKKANEPFSAWIRLPRLSS